MMVNKLETHLTKWGYHFIRLIVLVVAVFGAIAFMWGFARLVYGVTSFNAIRVFGGLLSIFVGAILSGGGHHILQIVPSKWRSLKEPGIDLSSEYDRARMAESFYGKNVRLVKELSRVSNAHGAPSPEDYVAATIKSIYSKSLTVSAFKPHVGWSAVEAFKDTSKYFVEEKTTSSLQRKYLKKLCRSVLSRANATR